jgi:hypothetical protein
MGGVSHHVMHYGAIAVQLRDPAGGVARGMLRRGLQVQSQARRNLAGGNGRPRRIDTGMLRASVYCVPVVVGGAPGARVGSKLRYARWVHDGTGLFGPAHRRITARKPGGWLVFTPKGARGKVFTRSVAGMVANPFLADAAKAAT